MEPLREVDPFSWVDEMSEWWYEEVEKNKKE